MFKSIFSFLLPLLVYSMSCKSYALPLTSSPNTFNTRSEVGYAPINKESNFEAMLAVGNCSGALIRFKGMDPTKKAIVLTNGHFIKDKMRVRGYIRYMDDFIAFSDNKKELQNLLSAINDFVVVKLKLELKPSATIIAPVSEGIPFLGFRIFSNLIRIKRENLIRWKRKIRLKEKLYLEGTISEIHLTQSIQSIIGHISHVNSLGVRRKVFEDSLKLVW